MNVKSLNRTVFIRDNLEVLRTFEKESIDLIYLDPPFNSHRNYGSPVGNKAAGFHFKDMWYLSDTDPVWCGELSEQYPRIYEIIHVIGCINGNTDKSYLIYMTVRLLQMHRILKETGSIYLHCDQKMSHPLKLIMDCLFGKENFVNEIIWHYRTGGASKKSFARKHDTILFYAKDFKKKKFFIEKEKNYTKAKSRKAGVLNYGQGDCEFFEDDQGVYNFTYMKDVWDIPYVNSMAKERVGYRTQKPLALLERIIKSSSQEGDIVLDPFCGCATTCIASEKLKRKWIGIDLSSLAEKLLKNRYVKELDLNSTGITFRKDIPIKSTSKPSRNIQHVLYGKQEGNCAGCRIHFPITHLVLSQMIYSSIGIKDGENHFQLLCTKCNSLKDNQEISWTKPRWSNIS